MKLYSRIKVGVAIVGAILLVGTAGFHWIEGWPWFDGLYMTLTTLTTIGYQELHPLSPAGRLFNTFLIIVGVSSLFFLIGAFTQAMIEFELGTFFGRRRLERQISKLEGHYIICGAGRVGRSAAREFRARPVPFVIIERDENRVRWAAAEEMLVLIGDATRDEILRAARIEKAKGLIAAVATDAENLYIVLTARGLHPTLPIIARASEEDAADKLRKAGATEVVSPYHVIGRRIAMSLLRPHVLDFIDVATTLFGAEDLDLQIEQVLVSDRSSLSGKTLEDSGIRRHTGVIILALPKVDGQMHFNPSAGSRIQGGDHLIAMGQPNDLKQLEAMAR
ncbi:MAG TPA: potassium channel protein [Candidatus Acidoferrales bacterium]